MKKIIRNEDHKNSPTLSVVMTNYNHSEFLPMALDNILSQTFAPIEIIIIDDASTDASMKILESYNQKYPLITIHRNKTNMGIIHNINRLLDLTSGDYFYSAAADDVILPGFFKKSMDMLSNNPQAGLCSTLCDLIDEHGNRYEMVTKNVFTRDAAFISPQRAKNVLQRNGNWIQGNATVYRKEALLEEGGFHPELFSYCDGFIAQVIALKHGACFIPEKLASWRRLASGYAITQNADLNRKYEIMNNAAHLMGTKYKELFPQRYIETWEKQELYAIIKIRMNLIANEQNELFANAFAVFENEPFFKSSSFFKIVDFSILLQKLLIKIFVYLHLRSFRKFLINSSNYFGYKLKQEIVRMVKRIRSKCVE